MTVEYIKSITDRYERLGYPAYKWYRADKPPPWTALKKPISESRLGVLTTAGAYVKGQIAFYYKDDTSYRAIAKGTPEADMRFSHITENYLPDARRDPNCVVPLEPLRRLEQDGVIGALADDYLSCMGGIYSQRRVHEELIPALTARYAKQAVDAVYLIPL